MIIDHYRTLEGESEGVYREKASKFIATAFPIVDEDAFQQRCDAIAKEHHTCRHVCYAWILGEAGDRFRANDAGEPAGTAGRPMLRQLQGAQLTHSAIVVVRYFGGTLLGKGGLVHAYAEAARMALSSGRIIERVLRTALRATCGYALVEGIRSDTLKCDGEVHAAEYGEPCVLHIAVRRSHVEHFIHRWTIAGAQVVIAQK